MADKDWVGNGNSIYKTLGASNHTNKFREENDFYATDPIAIELLLKLEKFKPVIWEPACGQGHLSKVLEDAGHEVISTDLINRGYGIDGINFIEDMGEFDGDIVTNPPYKFAKEFIYKALELVTVGSKVAMFLKVQFLEGKERKKLFTKFPPKIVYISSSRITCAKNADFKRMKEGGGSALAYGWYLWQKGYAGQTTLEWFN